MSTLTLSETALALLKRRVEGERVEVTPDNLEAYRELARAGLMIPLHTMTGGDESAFRLTEAGASLFASSRPASS